MTPSLLHLDPFLTTVVLVIQDDRTLQELRDIIDAMYMELPLLRELNQEHSPTHTIKFNALNGFHPKNVSLIVLKKLDLNLTPPSL